MTEQIQQITNIIDPSFRTKPRSEINSLSFIYIISYLAIIVAIFMGVFAVLKDVHRNQEAVKAVPYVFTIIHEPVNEARNTLLSKRAEGLKNIGIPNFTVSDVNHPLEIKFTDVGYKSCKAFTNYSIQHPDVLKNTKVSINGMDLITLLHPEDFNCGVNLTQNDVRVSVR